MEQKQSSAALAFAEKNERGLSLTCPCAITYLCGGFHGEVGVGELLDIDRVTLPCVPGFNT